MKTIVIMSRGMRLAPRFKFMAADLAKDYRVIVLINTVSTVDESQFWQDFNQGTVIDFYRRIRQVMRNPQNWSRSFINQIEAETGVTLYSSTRNYQLYRRLYKSYHGPWGWDHNFYADEKAITLEYVGSYLILTEIFEKYSPNVIFYESPDLITSFMALALGYNREKFALGFAAAPGLDTIKIVIPYGINRRNIILEKLFNSPDLLDQKARQASRDLISRFDQKKMSSPWYVQPHKKRVAKPIYLDPQKILQSLRHRKTWPNPLEHLRKMRNLAWLQNNSRKSIPLEPYLAFFLHFQPEASTSSNAPRWINQESIIEQLAINAPYGLKILAKEHPHSYGLRGQEYFGPLLEIPNVYMCHPTVNSYEVAQNAEAIFTIAGSIGLEGIFMKKRVAVLGRPYYSTFPGVKKLNYPEEIFPALRDPAWQPATMTEELENFGAAYISSAHDFGPVEKGQIWPSPEIGGPQMAQALRKTMKFVETHNLKPVDFYPEGIVT
jgi:hypothetical protein